MGNRKVGAIMWQKFTVRYSLRTELLKNGFSHGCFAVKKRLHEPSNTGILNRYTKQTLNDKKS